MTEALSCSVCCAGDRLLSLTVSTVSMQLEDALTIFSYSSPYPVQLSLIPATAAAAAPPLGRRPRSRSLDGRGGRRQRLRGEPGPGARSRSEGRSRATSDGEAGLLAAVAENLVPDQPQQEAQPSTVRSLHEGRRPLADGGENPATDSPADENNLPVDYSNVDRREILGSADPIAVDSRQTASAAADENRLEAYDGGAAMLLTSSPGVASSGATGFGTDAERKRADESPTIVVDGERGLRQLNKTPTGHRGDEITSSVTHHHNHEESRDKDEEFEEADQARQEGANGGDSGGETDVARPEEEGRDREENGGGDSSEQRSVESSSTTRPTTDDQSSEVFFDEEEQRSPGGDGRARKKKKRRGLMGSLRALLKSTGSRRSRRSSLQEGGAVPYLYVDEDLSLQTQPQAAAVDGAESSNVDYCNSVDDESRADRYDRQSDQFAPEAGELVSAPTDGVFDRAGAEQVRAENASRSLRRSNSDQLRVDEPRAATISGSPHQRRHDEDRTGCEELELVTFDSADLPAAVSEDRRDGWKLPTIVVSDDSRERRRVGETEFTQSELSAVAHDVAATRDEVEHATVAVGDEPQATDDVHRAGVHGDDPTVANQRSAVSSHESESQRPPSRIFQTDDISVATSAEFPEETTTTESAIIRNDSYIESLSYKDAKTGGDICEPLAAETDFDATVSNRSAFDSGSPVRQELIDEGDGANSDSTAVGASSNADGDDDRDRGMPLSDVESLQQRVGLGHQPHDIGVDDLSRSVVISATDPYTSAAARDVTGTASAARPRVFKDKRSPEIDVGGDVISASLRRPAVIVDVSEPPTFSRSTSDLRFDGQADARAPFFKDKRSSESELYSATAADKVADDIPSALTMLLDLLGAGDREKRAAATKSASGHRGAVAIAERPTTVSGGIGPSSLSPSDDEVAKSRRSAGDVKDNAGSEESAPAQTRHDPSAGSSTSHADPASSSERQRATGRTPPDRGGLTLSADDILARLREADLRDAARRATEPTHLSRRRHYWNRSAAVDFVPPTVSEVPAAENSPPPLVAGRKYSNSLDDVGGERSSRTGERFSAGTTRIHDDDPAVMGGVEDSKNHRTLGDRAIHRPPHIVGVHGNQMPTDSSKSPTTTIEDLKRINLVSRSSPGDFTFVVQRQMKVDERRSSTGSTCSYNTGSRIIDGEPPAYTFLMPPDRRRSASDFNNNEPSAIRRSSTPQTVSDGRQSDFTAAIPRYTATNSTAYNSWQTLDIAVQRSVVDGRLPSRTGSGNVFDSVGNSATAAVHRRLSESAGELRVGGARMPTVDEDIATARICAGTVSRLAAGHVTAANPAAGSVPNLASAATDDDDSPFLDVATTTSREGDVVVDRRTRLPQPSSTDARSPRPNASGGGGGPRWSWAEGGGGIQLPVSLRGGGAGPQHVARRRPRRRRVASLTQNSLDDVPTESESEHTTPTAEGCPTSSPATDT